jgi:small subunit ribosomal protein S2
VPNTEVEQEVNIKTLLEAGLHFGHQTKRWNPKMRKYIFDKRSGIHIIDLAKSLNCLNEALNFIYEVVSRGQSVLFVGTKKQAQDAVKEAAERCGQHYVTHRWLGGTLTNNSTIRNSVNRMLELERMERDGELENLSKKEASRLYNELNKLRRNLTGISAMTGLPGVLFVVDIDRESIAVAEANRLNIPVVAMVDTNCDPAPVDYPIPGNDDAIRAIRLISNLVADTVLRASSDYQRIAAEAEMQAMAEENKQQEAAEKPAAEEQPAATGETPAATESTEEGGEQAPASSAQEPAAKSEQEKPEEDRNT